MSVWHTKLVQTAKPDIPDWPKKKSKKLQKSNDKATHPIYTIISCDSKSSNDEDG